MALKVGELFAELTLDSRPYTASLNAALSALSEAAAQMNTQLNQHAAYAADAGANAGSAFVRQLLEEMLCAPIGSVLASLAQQMRNIAAPLLVSAGNSSGARFSEGLAQGVRAGQSQVSAAAESVARAAVQAANAYLKIASPSRLMAQSGAYFSEGFAQGVEKSARLAAEAASGMSRRAAEAATNRQSAPIVDYDRLESILNHREISLYLNGKQLARTCAAENERAQRSRRQSLALGYGLNGR